LYTFILVFGIRILGVKIMETVTLPLRLPKKLISEVDLLVKAGLYETRSEAIRDSIRRLIEAKRLLLEPHHYYGIRVEEALKESKRKPLEADETIEELRKIREELWRREKEYFEI